MKKKNPYKYPTVMVNGKQKKVSHVVMEEFLKRNLLQTEIVHHIDHNPYNNDIINLQVVSRSEHKKLHSDIGMKTRLKKEYNFDKLKLIEEYNKYKSVVYLSKLYNCHEMTIERELRKILDVRSLKVYAKEKGWGTNYRRQQKRGTTYEN